MTFKIVIRGAAYLVLAVALLATAIVLNNRQYQAAGSLQVEPLSATDNLAVELTRCKVLGIGAANDARCKAAWQASRERFLNGNNLYRDHAPVSRPPVFNKPAGGRLPSPRKRTGQPQ